MPSGRLRDVVVIVACMLVSAVAVAVDPAASGPEWVFGSLVLLCLVVLAREAGGSAVRSWRERRRERSLHAMSARDSAARAVVQERARLGRDIETAVRGSVTRMAALADHAATTWDRDPTPLLRALGDEGREAITELRRMVGLLRDAGVDGAPAAVDAGHVTAGARADGPRRVPPAAGPRSRGRRGPLALGLLVGTIALLEHLTYAGQAQPGSSPLTTVLAAGLTGLALVRPLAAVLSVAGVVALGWAAGMPVGPGLWMLAGLGTVAWACTRWGQPLLGFGAVLVMGTLVVLNQHVLDPSNALFVGMVVVAGAGGGWAVRAGERTERAAHLRALDREHEIQAAVQAAVRADALAVARDLHDLVSSAVGVMVVHAGAAEALRDRSPRRARAALETVRATAAETLDEVSALTSAVDDGALGVSPGTRPGQDATPAHQRGDLHRLVDRMRGAGLDVQLVVSGEVDRGLTDTVYRVVQESLTNAVRHAPGSRVRVSVTTDTEQVRVEVADDGPGSPASARRGYGLVGLSERARSLGGSIEAGPLPGGDGFRVSVRLPARARVAGTC